MFEAEQQAVEKNIQAYCTQHGLPEPGLLQWSPIPFSGEWGISTSFFQLAALEARQGRGKGIPVPARQESPGVAELIGTLPGFARVEAVKGYLNLYFSTSEYARRVVDTVLLQGDDFGRGAPKGERVMVEYAQPNTHHSFHIGHSRNALLGEAFARLVEFAGFETIRASYPGDVGLGVITVALTRNQRPGTAGRARAANGR
jgi:arginyl-tRNA synthetase